MSAIGNSGSTVLASPGSGAGQTTLQGAYDNSSGADPQILLNNTPTPISIQASVAGAILEVRDVGNANTIFEVDGDPDLIVARAGITVEDAFTNGAATTYLTFADTFTTGGGYLGGCILSNGTITYNNSFFIWALLQESKTYNAAAGPGFAAFTLFNALAIIQNSGNFDLVQALILNNGVVHSRTSSGTSTTTQNVGLSNSPQTRATVSGAVMTKSSGDTAVNFRSTFSTVAGSTVNLGNNKAVNHQTPAVALFQPSAGIENATALITVDVDTLAFGGNITKRALRSAIPEATNALMIENTGGANSDFGGGGIHFDDATPVQFGGTAFNAQDASIFWNAAGTLDFFFAAQSDTLSLSNSVNDQIVFAVAAGQEMAFDADRGIVFGDSATLGNQFFSFNAQAQTPDAAGDYSCVLLTQAANYTNDGNAMGRVSAWVINGLSYASSSGSVANADTLTVGGMVTSSPGVTITDRQSLNVIGGRSRFSSIIQTPPITPATLAAGNNNDYGGFLTGTANNGMRGWARVTGDGGGTSAITGIDATEAQDGDTIVITNIGSVNFSLVNQSASSSAANRIILGSFTGGIPADDSITVKYDATTARWRVVDNVGAL